MKKNNFRIEKRMFITLFLLILFMFLLSVNSKAVTETPKITISGATDGMVTESILDSYTLTIDYSQVADLTNLQLYYKVDEGEWKPVTYKDSETSVKVLIRGGMDGFVSDKALHKISVYAENEAGKSEILEQEILFYYYASKTLTNTEHDVTVKTVQYPLNTLLEVEHITDKSMLSKIPLDNMTLYKITLKADSQLAGPLLKKYKKYPEQSYISVTVPLSESVKKAIENGVPKGKVGYIIDKEYKYQQTSWTPLIDNANYFEFINSYTKQILDDGYIYLAIATGEKSNKPDDKNTNNTVNNIVINDTNKNGTNKNDTTNNAIDDNTTATGELPQTGIAFTIIIVLAVVSIACAVYTSIRIKNMKNID